MFRSSDEGIIWNQCGDIKNVSNFFINDSNYIYAISSEFYVEMSANHGVSWDTIGDFFNPFYGTVYGICQNLGGKIFISTHNIFLNPYAVEYKRLLKTENNGLNWSQVRNDLFIKNIYFINDTMYMAASNQTLNYNPGGIYKSYDNGFNIVPLSNGLSNYDVRQLILTPDVFICLTGNGIYRSLDQGNYWVPLDLSGLLSTQINRIYYSDNGTLYACTNNGIGVFVGDLPVELLSFTGQAEGQNVILNWATASELNNHGFEIQRKFGNNDWVTIGFKEGKGTTSEQSNYSYIDDISRLSASEVYYRIKQIDFNGSFSYSDEIKVGLIPLEYNLFQNYPNPFNPVTVIKYSIAERTKVNLTVYDILGNEIKTLVNENKEPGYYEINFESENLSSGIYLYRLNTNNFVSIKKMVIIK